jgi:hypothetical protein
LNQESIGRRNHDPRPNLGGAGPVGHPASAR